MFYGVGVNSGGYNNSCRDATTAKGGILSSGWNKILKNENHVYIYTII